MGFTQPGMTIVCGDSHTSTHGAFGTIAFGIGTSEVEMVMATQCLLQTKPKLMRINVSGNLTQVSCLKTSSCISSLKFPPAAPRAMPLNMPVRLYAALSMEARMTICNMSIEMGARCGMIAPDETTFSYMKGRKYAPQGNRMG